MTNPNNPNDFVNIIKECHEYIKENSISKECNEESCIEAFFSIYEKKFINKQDAIEEKRKNIGIACEVYNGLHDINESKKKIGAIKANELQQLKEANSNLCKISNALKDQIDSNKNILTKFLFVSHLANIQKIPQRLLQLLRQKEISEANKVLISFSKLYEKHRDQLNLDQQLFSSDEITNEAKLIVSTFDIKVPFDPYDFYVLDVYELINKSMGAMSFLMNFDYLYNLSHPDKRRDPFDDFGFFLFTWNDIINRIKKCTEEDARSLSSEISVFHQTVSILNYIANSIIGNESKGEGLIFNLIPNIISDQNLDSTQKKQKLKDQLFNKFMAIKTKIINSFYFVKNGEFSGRFFKIIDTSLDENQKIGFKDYAYSKFNTYDVKAIIFNVQVERYIDCECSNIERQKPTINLNISNINISQTASDISVFLLYHFTHKKMQPEQMLKIFLNVLLILIQPSVNDPSAITIYLSDSVVPYLISIWSNCIVNSILTPNMEHSLSNVKTKINDIYSQTQFEQKLTALINEKSHNNSLLETFIVLQSNFISAIIESTVATISQIIIDHGVKTSAKRNFLDFIKDILRSENLNEQTKKMAIWVENKTS